VNTGELVAYARLSATVENESSEYTAAVVTGFLNDAMRVYFEPIVETARSGFWLHSLTRALAPGNPYVRLHPRACALEQIDLRQGSGDWHALTEALESELQDWPQRAYSWPQVYVVRGNTILLQPAATADDLQLRAKCTIRPSQLVTEQTAGRVTAVDVNTRTITVNALPVDGVTNATIGGALVIDVIEPRGYFELSLFDAPAAVMSSTTLLVDPGPSLSRIEVGDYVRAAGQTDWPQLPESFHSVLADAAAITICRQRDMYDRASELAATASAAAQRMQGQLTPRTRAQNHRPLQHSWGR